MHWWETASNTFFINRRAIRWDAWNYTQWHMWRNWNKSLSGAEFLNTFIDDRSRFAWVSMMKHKSRAFQNFLEWKVIVEKLSKLKIKLLNIDNNGAYTSTEFQEYLQVEVFNMKQQYQIIVNFLDAMLLHTF